MASSPRVLVIGAGIGGLTTAALLAESGCEVTVLEAGAYPGGSAGTFYRNGYRLDAGATLAGGFQPGGPHALVGDRLGIDWPVHSVDHAWMVHLPDRHVRLAHNNADVLRQFPGTEPFWNEQIRIADLGWQMAAHALPWPPADLSELALLTRIGAAHLPDFIHLLPLAFSNVQDRLRRYGLAQNEEFVRFLDALLLISAQITSAYANVLYSATALDLPRQGVCHVRGGIGSLAQTLADKIEALGGRVLYKHRVTGIDVQNGRVARVRVLTTSRAETVFACDFAVANLTPWSLDELLDEASPARLRREAQQRDLGWGAFVLYLGVQADRLPPDFSDSHQMITTPRGPLGEGRSVFMSLSPRWDTTRAPAGFRAATVTTHTAVQLWWDLMARDPAAYEARKAEYTERMLATIEQVIPGFCSGLSVVISGTPVTYHTWTHRHMCMVGGFPQSSIFKARSPRTGLPNLRLVGDSIFPGQSTTGVTAGAMRVAADVRRSLPRHAARKVFVSPLSKPSSVD
ncbi:MAG: FAD-dependent oxidoreductase [Chloroflexi bacterium]|nr:FAD-dependent oxidoreductase [Chloroflexota bacterium]